MDPFEVHAKVESIAAGSSTETSLKIAFDVDFSGDHGLSKAFADVLIPFSIGHRESTNVGNWRQPKCSICSKTKEWSNLFQALDDGDKKEAMKALSENRIPTAALLKIATSAPFGKGDKTVVDTNVRNALEIPAATLGEVFPMTKPISKKISDRIASEMTPGNATWKYKLYKMHIYEKGGKFAPHVDTLHAENHVATLVVGLPGEYKGGELIVKQRGKAESYNLSSSAMNVKWAAFYTDCTHEVLEVSEGTRVVLQYDIYEEKDEETAVADATAETAVAHAKTDDYQAGEDDEDEDDEDEDFEPYHFYGHGIPPNVKDGLTANTLVKAVTKALKCARSGSGVGLLMRHRYSLGSLKSSTLKGADRLVYDALAATGQFAIALTGLVVSATTEEGRYMKSELVVNAISIGDFDPNESAVEFPCQTCKLFIDSAGRESDELKRESYIEYTGNEAQEGSMAYRFSAFVIAKKEDENGEDKKKHGMSLEEGQNNEKKRSKTE